MVITSSAEPLNGKIDAIDATPHDVNLKLLSDNELEQPIILLVVPGQLSLDG
jgi:hypothetical protein